MIEKLIFVGQTGANLSAVDFGIELGLLHGGWVPKRINNKDGRFPQKYGRELGRKKILLIIDLKDRP